MSATAAAPIYFDSADDFRRWLAEQHGSVDEVWVGYWKKGADGRGITYAESVDEALCHGWIDGLTRTVDERRYATRFTPRRPRSNWSQANIKRVAELIVEGRMRLAGLAAFEARREPAPGEYTYETRPKDLPDECAVIFRRNEAAWRFYSAQIPSYRRSTTWWVVSARREETRLRRLDALIAESAAGRIVDDLNLPRLATAGASKASG